MYKIYYRQDQDYVYVTKVHEYNIYQYSSYAFYKDKNGKDYEFEYENDAINFMNSKFKREYILPEQRRGDNLFGRMLKGAEGP